jgi:hypothetical protein
MRRCVHEYGLPIVDACLTAGVQEPRRIRQLVRDIWCGTRDTGNQKLVGHKGMIGRLEWVLAQNNSPIGAMTLLRILEQSDFYIVPRTPWACMVEASMNETRKHGLLTKQEKHRVRLIAAVKAAARFAWPHLEH